MGLKRIDKQPWVPNHFIKQYQAAWLIPTTPIKEEKPEKLPVIEAKKREPQTQREMEQFIELWVRGSNITYQEGKTHKRKRR